MGIQLQLKRLSDRVMIPTIINYFAMIKNLHTASEAEIWHNRADDIQTPNAWDRYLK